LIAKTRLWICLEDVEHCQLPARRQLEDGSECCAVKISVRGLQQVRRLNPVWTGGLGITDNGEKLVDARLPPGRRRETKQYRQARNRSFHRLNSFPTRAGFLPEKLPEDKLARGLYRDRASFSLRPVNVLVKSS
jgi:hypothetical protein